MVYQGLTLISLIRFKFEHIDLERVKIYVPSTRKTNGRELEIKLPQILSLAKFINESREILQDSIGCHTEAFIPLNGDRFEMITYWLFKKLRRINHNLRNSKQIRASVITYWLQNHNIREVQYMAGHRYISSTERYVQGNLESFQEVIESLHPIS
jgi:integrase/recombinase XerD